MRLGDLDALAERAVYANLSTEVVDVLVDLIDAAPVVSCEGCVIYNGVDHMDTPTCAICYCGDEFQPSDAGGAW